MSKNEINICTSFSFKLGSNPNSSKSITNLASNLKKAAGCKRLLHWFFFKRVLPAVMGRFSSLCRTPHSWFSRPINHHKNLVSLYKPVKEFQIFIPQKTTYIISVHFRNYFLDGGFVAHSILFHGTFQFIHSDKADMTL